MNRASLLFAALALGSALTAGAPAAPLRLQGSPVVAHAMSAAAPVLRERGLEVKVSTEGGSTAAIYAAGSELVDMAMATRELTAEDRAAFPEKQFHEFQIGAQAVAVIVPRAIWDSGVREVSKQQMLGIYEGQITNWKQLGGENRPLKFFSSERGRGTWEVFAQWLYGDVRRAPVGKFEIVIGGEDARNTVQFNAGSISIAAPEWADGKEICALAIKDEAGRAIAPTLENIAARTYPLARPAMLIVADRPLGSRKQIIDFMLGPQGQELIKRSELIPVAALGR